LLAVAIATALTALLAPVHAPASAVAAPPVHGRFDYQIGGAYRPAGSVTVVDRDWHDRPAVGTYSVCYVNAFQTQPEEDGWWRRHHPHLLLHDAAGRRVEDPGWPGEFLLDTSTATHRSRLAHIVGGWMRSCRAKGFAGVEPDNLDSWSRSHHLLSRHDNIAFARLLVRRAHRLGLAIAQKNAVEIARTGHRIGFDFAIAEECQVYAECSGYRAAYGRHVIEIEYTDNPRRYFRTACARRGDAVSVVLRDRDVVPRGHRGYVERWC
jgi:hypothetical protein